MQPSRSIFREKAIQEHIQKQEKDILPHFVSPSLFICSYVLLFLFLLTGLWTLWREVPVFATGSGIVSSKGSADISRKHTVRIVLFLPAQYASHIRRGTYAQIEIEAARQQVAGTVTSIETGIINPDEARKRYKLTSAAMQTIPQLSIATIITPVATHIPHLYAGDSVSAQVQIGSQRMFSLLSGR